MRELDEAALKELIKQLDEGVSREGAVVLEDEGGGSYGDAAVVVTANRRGYLRLGIEYLKAAFAEPRSEVQPHRVDIDIPYIDGLQGSLEPFERHILERREDPCSALGESEKLGVLVTAMSKPTFALPAHRPSVMTSLLSLPSGAITPA